MKILKRDEVIDETGQFKTVTSILQDDSGKISTVVWAGMADEEAPDPAEIVSDDREHTDAVLSTRGYKQ